MFEVKMLTNSLLSIVEENRKLHEENYNKAVEAWKIQLKDASHAVIDSIGDDVESIKNSKAHLSRISSPEEHLDDYDKIIGMLRNHRDEFIVLDEDAYDNYVNDNWRWSHSYFSNTMSKI